MWILLMMYVVVETTVEGDEFTLCHYNHKTCYPYHACKALEDSSQIGQ